MDNVQNCDSYINIPPSETYREGKAIWGSHSGDDESANNGRLGRTYRLRLQGLRTSQSRNQPMQMASTCWYLLRELHEVTHQEKFPSTIKLCTGYVHVSSWECRRDHNMNEANKSFEKVAIVQ
jgi:hypothetical protein